MSKLWLGEDGTLILDQDGKAVYSATDPCCCVDPAPGTCPTTADEYLLLSWTRDDGAGNLWRLDPADSPLSLPRFGVGCRWDPTDSHSLQSYNSGLGTWGALSGQVSNARLVTTGTPHWSLEVLVGPFSVSFTVKKFTGLTLAGLYISDDGFATAEIA